MVSKRKRLDAMRANPRGDWTIEDLIAVAEDAGFTCKPPKSGSHWRFRPPGRREPLTVPARRPVRAVYVKQVIALIDAVEEEDG